MRTVADVPLPPERRFGFDYQSLDTDSGRLYIAHMNANQLVVFDTASRKVHANLSGFARIHGVWAVPEIARVFASVTGDHAVAVVDMPTLRTVAKIGPVNYPDGISFTPVPKQVFVSDEHGNADVVIDAQNNRLVKKIELGGGAGNTVFDSSSGQVLVAVHEKRQIGRDRCGEAGGDWALSVARYQRASWHSLLDAANRLAFVAGAGNHMLALVDLANMKVIGLYPVGADPDVLAFDPRLKQLYVSAESGNVWVYREDGRSLKEVGHRLPRAHTVCVDPRTNLVYFPLENVGGHPLLG